MQQAGAAPGGCCGKQGLTTEDLQSRSEELSGGLQQRKDTIKWVLSSSVWFKAEKGFKRGRAEAGGAVGR